ncbi:hypothetical protein IMSAGC007_03486 [Lachnospiraceae bacterium]|nr:hypothetical protein IMSAGC007_03486 [Lachnospiraceae bacterium]
MERSVADLSKYRYDCSCEALEDAKIMYTLNGQYFRIKKIGKGLLISYS